MPCLSLLTLTSGKVAGGHRVPVFLASRVSETPTLVTESEREERERERERDSSVCSGMQPRVRVLGAGSPGNQERLSCSASHRGQVKDTPAKESSLVWVVKSVNGLQLWGRGSPPPEEGIAGLRTLLRRTRPWASASFLTTLLPSQHAQWDSSS